MYEEAQPLKKAWQMRGWGPDASPDLNPHFFNYPSLTIYVQLGAQEALYAGMRLAGVVQSADEFRIRYHTDPTPFYLLGRLLNVVFGLLTVLLLYRISAVALRAGRTVAAAAPLLLSLSFFHIARSQMVEVDVPLTFFVLLGVSLSLRLAESPSSRSYALAGLAAGLATATKYTGAIAFLPVVAAHFAARRSPRARGASRRGLLVSGVMFAVAFAAASPFVVADAPAFWEDFTAERSHMSLGHFGLEARSALGYYAVALARRLAGWPALLLSAAGLVHSLAFKRETWSFVVAAFVLPYAVAISSWAMMADRYALPLLPFLFLYAVAGVRFFVSVLPPGLWWRRASVAAAALALAAPVAFAAPGHFSRYETDSRTRCLDWIERNVPAGSFVVSEAYGPPLEGPVQYWQWPGDIRDRIFGAYTEGGRPFLSLFEIPMFQVEWEQAAPFYDLRLYRDADWVLTTGAVRSRYSRDPDRFPRQAEFYRRLETEFDEAARFDAAGTGPSIVVYRSVPARPPFSKRPAGTPPDLRPGVPLRPHWFGEYYYRMAVNCEAWNHLPQAIAGYQKAMPFTQGDSEVYREVVFGMVRCLTLSGQRDLALEFVDRVKPGAPSPADLRFVERLEAGIEQSRP